MAQEGASVDMTGGKFVDDMIFQIAALAADAVDQLVVLLHGKSLPGCSSAEAPRPDGPKGVNLTAIELARRDLAPGLPPTWCPNSGCQRARQQPPLGTSPSERRP